MCMASRPVRSCASLYSNTVKHLCVITTWDLPSRWATAAAISEGSSQLSLMLTPFPCAPCRLPPPCINVTYNAWRKPSWRSRWAMWPVVCSCPVPLKQSATFWTWWDTRAEDTFQSMPDRTSFLYALYACCNCLSLPLLYRSNRVRSLPASIKRMAWCYSRTIQSNITYPICSSMCKRT